MFKRLTALFGAAKKTTPATPAEPAPSPVNSAAQQRAEALKDEGNRHLAANALDDAERYYKDALRECPDYAPALNNLGQVSLRRGRSDEARAYWQRALAINPQLAQAHFNLAELAREKDDADLAVLHYERCLAINANNEDALLGLAHAFVLRKENSKAEARLRAALAAGMDTPSIHAFLGGLALTDDRIDEAKKEFAIALARDPKNTIALSGVCALHERHGEWEQALSLMRTVNTLDGSVNRKLALATMELRIGELTEGFRLQEHRLETEKEPYAYFADLNRIFAGQTRWTGEDVTGKRLLVMAEQGLGDMLMFARYLPALRHLGAAEIQLCVPPPLQRFMAEQNIADQVLSFLQVPSPGSYDLYCYSMSLPHLLNTTRGCDPGGAPVPYLHADASARQTWAERLAHLPGRKVGLVWAGNPALIDDAKRSMSLDQLAPLLATPGVSFVSLQKGDFPGREIGHHPVHDWMADCKDMADTAALICELDLVIAVDTAVAHLSGALGQKIWVLNRFNGDWRWGLRRTDSPWYPTLTLFTQTAPGDWDGVVQRVVKALGEMVGE